MEETWRTAASVHSRARAREVDEVAFSWRARFPIVPFVWLDVVDRYADGEGMLEARALGCVLVMRHHGPEISQGAAEGDYRDWDEVTAWATGIAEALQR